MGEIDFFIAELAKIKLANVFNPYSNICREHDMANASLIRRENLRLVFEAGLANGTRSVWVGRDLGYLGGRRTGIALIDEVRPAPLARRLGIQGLAKATRTPDVQEATATSVWEMVELQSEVPMLWNAFPLHPHEPGIPATNRQHSRVEAEATKHFLAAFLTIFRPQRVIAVGKDAHELLARLGQQSIRVRHPSYGGKMEFRRGIEDAYR